MVEFLELLRFLSATGEVAIIWVLISIFVLGCVKVVPHVADYFKAKAEAQKEIAKREIEHMKEMERKEGERNEILKNTNYVIDNNSQALHQNTQTIKGIQDFIRNNENKYLAAISSHEKMSAEREQHLQTVLNRNSDGIQSINSKMEILLDRD